MQDIQDFCKNVNLEIKNGKNVDFSQLEGELKKILSAATVDGIDNNNSNVIMYLTKLLLLTSPILSIQPSASSQNEPLDLSQKHQPAPKSLPKRLWKPKSFDFEEFFATHVRRFTANDVCNSRCQMLYKDHYHCFAENGNCSEVMKGKDQVRQHGKRHCVAEELTNLEFKFCLKCNSEEAKSHYHCSYANCCFVSSHLSNLHRLNHVESVHCNIVLKRANTNHYKNKASGKKCKMTQYDKEQSQSFSNVTNLPFQMSPISPGSYDNQFIDMKHDPFDKQSSISSFNSPSKLNESREQTAFDDIENNVLVNVKDEERYLYRLGTCARLFCNLKKANHYHCPICDVGSSKIDLYLRHLKRHK